MAARHGDNCLAVLKYPERRKEGVGGEVKCVGGRSVEGQDRESIWKCLLATSVHPDMNWPLPSSLHLKAQKQARA